MTEVYRILAFLIICWPWQAQAQDADNVFASVIERYQKGISATFQYTMSSEIWDQDLFYSGQILLKDDEYRIENDEELIIGRGPDTWIYRAADSQILISTALEDDLAFAPGHLFANYQEHLSIDALRPQTSGLVPHYVLELRPRSDDYPLREVGLFVRQSDGIITLVEAADHNDTLISIRLSDVVLGPEIGPEAFIMPTPAGVEVIDLR